MKIRTSIGLRVYGLLDFGVLLGLQFVNGTVAFFEEHNAGNAADTLTAWPVFIHVFIR